MDHAPHPSYSKLAKLSRPSEEVFRSQLEYVRNYADQRSERAAEILAQVGYPTEFFTSVVPLNAVTHSHTLQLISLVQQLASHVVLRTKHSLACRRPDIYSAQIQPIIPTPGHGTLPSGHSTEAFTVATVFGALLDDTIMSFQQSPSIKELLLSVAERIAVNRTVAGVHFPADSTAGAALGTTLGHYLLQLASGESGDIDAVEFIGNNATGDFDKSVIALGDGDSDPVVKWGTSEVHGEPDNLFRWLWLKAKSEWEEAPAAGGNNG
ncbi:hypothetical protein WH95_02140 [Kiloniella litopenaei]|uniref:Phosphatidic acid phosphatase type 2/haloperoxidase domain-containing protein n=1 Tax=Kiloniella litopenaei TaxID=1549748 RepID=A0A0M2REN7_9PROT|nr:hypothetical protein WH95_02140 [Kiloniella litopenaei]